MLVYSFLLIIILIPIAIASMLVGLPLAIVRLVRSKKTGAQKGIPIAAIALHISAALTYVVIININYE